MLGAGLGWAGLRCATAPSHVLFRSLHSGRSAWGGGKFISCCERAGLALSPLLLLPWVGFLLPGLDWWSSFEKEEEEKGEKPACARVVAVAVAAVDFALLSALRSETHK